MDELACDHRLLLMAHDPQTGRCLAEATAATCGVVGAMVAELVLLERVRIDDAHRVHAGGAAPVSVPRLDALHERIASRSRPRKAKAWIRGEATNRLWSQARRAAVSEGVLAHEQRRILGMFPAHRYRPRDPARREQLHAELRAVLAREQAGDARDLATLALLRAMGLDRRLFPEHSWSRRRRLFKELTEDQPLAPAVASAIGSLQTAAIAATGVEGSAPS